MCTLATTTSSAPAAALAPVELLDLFPREDSPLCRAREKGHSDYPRLSTSIRQNPPASPPRLPPRPIAPQRQGAATATHRLWSAPPGAPSRSCSSSSVSGAPSEHAPSVHGPTADPASRQQQSWGRPSFSRPRGRSSGWLALRSPSSSTLRARIADSQEVGHAAASCRCAAW